MRATTNPRAVRANAKATATQAEESAQPCTGAPAHSNAGSTMARNKPSTNRLENWPSAKSPVHDRTAPQRGLRVRSDSNPAGIANELKARYAANARANGVSAPSPAVSNAHTV